MKQLIQKHKEEIGQFLRFGIVGGTATAIHYGVYCAVLIWSNHATLSYTVGYGVAFVFNYLLTTYFTFRSKPNTHNMAGFGFSHLINYVLEVGLLNLFLYMGMSTFLAPIVVLLVVIPANFAMLHFFYKARKKKQS